MALSVNTNIPSLIARKHLKNNTEKLNSSINNISSGYRVRSAKDNAASLAIANRFTSKIQGTGIAIKNANTAISMVQTADNSLGEYNNILQNMRELALQSANGSLTSEARGFLQGEYDTLASQLDNIVSYSNFNGLNMFDGTMGAQQFQIGPDSNQTLTVSFGNASISDIGGYAEDSSTINTNNIGSIDMTGIAVLNSTSGGAGNTQYRGVDSSVLGSGELVINGTSIPAADAGANGRGADSALAKSAAINNAHISNLTASAEPPLFTSVNTNGMAVTQSASQDASFNFLVNDVPVYTNETSSKDVDQMVADINTKTAQTGVVASKSSDGNLVMTSVDGRNIELSSSFTRGTGIPLGILNSFATNTAVTSTVGLNKASIRGQVKLFSTDDITINGSNTQSIGFNNNTTLSSKDNGSLVTTSISDVSGATLALKNLDSALTDIGSTRAGLGASHNRLESVISNLSTTVENLTAAKGRIIDADIASEMAELIKQNVMQQADINVLSQANSLPQAILSLLE